MNYFPLYMYMQIKAIHIFIILIGGLLICNLLGGSCIQVEGMTSYTGSAGDTVYVYDNSNNDMSYNDMSYNDISYNDYTYSSYDSNINDYNTNYNSINGIPKSQIPAGQEDLYILKSQIVPPVCPACPPQIISKEKTCPPCKPCGRCPEPAFECKKVPSYSPQNIFLPRPVLNDFSQFGM